MRWVADEEESFGRTLDRGTELLAKLIAEAKEASTSWIDAEDAFRLHDTYGFPYDLTKELLAEQGLAVDDEGFEALMEQQRERARGAAAGPGEDRHQAVISFVSDAPPTRFVGYEELSAQTSVAAAIVARRPAQLIKLEESPFYAEGGGQVADSGLIVVDGHELTVEDVYRVGDDQAIRATTNDQPATAGAPVHAQVDHEPRHATMRNHTATHLLHAALRERLGTHVRQAGSAVRPDKLRFDFTHGAPLAPEELRAIEDRVNDWVKASRPVRALEMERAEAEALGAMALFGEKYGDWVRVVEVDEVSRELCGGTHVANTAEVGIVAIVSEGSSAANVRRIEALTGPAAIDYYRARSDELDEAGALLGSPRDPLAGARRATGAAGRARAQGRRPRPPRGRGGGRATRRGGRGCRRGEGRRRRGRPAPTSGPCSSSPTGSSSALATRRWSSAAPPTARSPWSRPSALARSSAGSPRPTVLREAAAVVGGGGGGRDDVAQAGGRQPERLPEALDAAREAIRRALS